jgi:hypothetical protein
MKDPLLKNFLTTAPGPKFTKLNDEIWVLHNFLSKEEIKEILDEYNELFKEVHEAVYSKSLEKYTDRLKEYIDGDFTVHPMQRIVTRGPDDGHPMHTDIQNYLYKFIDCFVNKDLEIEKEEISIGAWGLVLYFNDDYTGGEINYPEYNFAYKPVAGDLIMHNADIVHQVYNVKEGLRLTHATNLRQKFFMDKNKSKNLKWPDRNATDFDVSDYYLDVDQVPTLSKRLKPFQDQYLKSSVIWYDREIKDKN